MYVCSVLEPKLKKILTSTAYFLTLKANSYHLLCVFRLALKCLVFLFYAKHLYAWIPSPTLFRYD